MSFDALLELYSDLATVIQRGGRVYPAALERYDDAPLEDLVKPSTQPLWIDPRLRAAGQDHLEAVARRSPQMHDGRVLACTAVDGPAIKCAAGSFFDAILTSDSLRAEYVENASRGRAARAGLSALPLRELAHEAAGRDVLRCGRGRVAAIGVSVAVTLPSQPARALVLGLRSDDLATDPGIWHVAPSGTLEPGDTDPLIGVVARELSEELGIRLGTADDLAGRLTPLGVGFDLLRLRPEICLRLDLNRHEYPPGGPHLSASEFRDRRLVELSAASMNRFWQTHPPKTLTPAAAATIGLLEACS